MPELRADEVCVWIASLDVSATAIERDWVSLDAEERERALRFARDRDRRWFVARRGARRAILARYLGCHPAAVRVTSGRLGKPEVDGGGLRFSSSHSRGLALVAVTRDRSVGVDVERLRPVHAAEEIARSLFASQERAAVLAEPPERRDRRFLGVWTRKEALVKASGEGLRRALASVETTGSAAFGRWSLAVMAPAPGYVAAIAAEGAGWRVRCRSW